MSLLAQVLHNVLKPLFEPVKSDVDNASMNEDRVGDTRHEHHCDLLIEKHVVQIDSVETGLCSRTGGEEQCIDVRNVVCAKDDNGSSDSHAYEVEIVNHDEGEARSCAAKLLWNK